MINSFFFQFYSRIIQENFQPKMGRKVGIFSLARKNILISKKSNLDILIVGPPTKLKFS